MKKRHLQTSSNYRFQQEQHRRQQHQKMMKLKEKIEKTPVSADEELDYIKKLLNGEDVGNFGPEEPEVVEVNEPLYWSSGNPWLVNHTSTVSKMSLSELLSIGTIKQRKRK